MAYRDFKTLTATLTAFELTLQNQSKIVHTTPVVPSEMLKAQLDEGVDLAVNNDTEKAHSELIVSPILLEVRRQLKGAVSLFSGSTLNVDASAGLNGECDFILSASPNQLEPMTPIVTLVEAKNNDTKLGLGQCIAQMVGAQRLNRQQGNCRPVYGAVTTGVTWRFMTLSEAVVTIDLREYLVPPQVEWVLGRLVEPFRPTLELSSN
jgi:hypothetical protein